MRMLLILGLAMMLARAADAGRNEDWARDILAARAATLADGKPKARVVRSELLKPMQEAQRLELDVTGSDTLWLHAEGVPDYHYARASWCEPELVKADGTVVRLTEVKPAEAKVGWGQMLINKDLNNHPLKIKDRTFKFGYWVHAESTLRFRLDKQYVKFRAWVGVTGALTPGSSRFTAADAPLLTASKSAAQQALDKSYVERAVLTQRLFDAWMRTTADAAGTRQALDQLTKGMKKAESVYRQRLATLDAAGADEPQYLALAAEIDDTGRGRDELLRGLELLDPPALRRAIDDLGQSFEQYPAAQFRARLDAIKLDTAALKAGVESLDPESMKLAREALSLKRDALLANPLLDFDKLLLIRRNTSRLGLPQNWQSNCVLPRTGYGNDLAVLSPVSPDGTLTTLYRPAQDVFVGDLELHPDATRLMFSMSDPKKPWHVYELKLGGGMRQVTPDIGADVDNYDACYLPNGDVLFTSNATMVAVPCVNGSTAVANIFRMSPDGKNLRQLCFDQEHNWSPRVMNNGRILYHRWEYADLPHSNSRRLFHMNPDGTGQMAFYGSNSYWPNGVFYARPIPGKPSEVVGIVSGHHGVPRMGELLIFDPRKGASATAGVVQRIPGYGKKVEPLVRDQLVDASWPKFLHPWPLGREDGRGSGKYFLVSAKPTPHSAWGIYLVDVFDNMLLIKEDPAYVMFEPVPLKPRPTPPVVPDRVDLERTDATVFLSDIYAGPGLTGIPRGQVKSIRVFSYVYGYRNMGGLYGTIGMDGPWDMRRVLGTVPVEPDGSAHFRVPANTPISVQPLDRDGKALQVMRSWFTAMPGEVLSCVGCHETQNDAPPVKATLAAVKKPTNLAQWYGKTRGFAFAREVQPVLDVKCVTCHNGQTKFQDRPLMSLRGDQPLLAWTSKMPGHQNAKTGGKFSLGYANLHRYVRHPGIESDMLTLSPMDYHADTTELVQLLKKGHYDVKLTAQEWDRIVTWIDLNTPFHGDWATICGDDAVAREKRRAELRKELANVDEFHIDAPLTPPAQVKFLDEVPAPARTPVAAQPPVKIERKERTLDLGEGVKLTLVYIPPGEFVMGSDDGPADEKPAGKVKLAHGFWIATTVTTNEQFRRFDPTHDSRRESKQGYQFGVEGYSLNGDKQPAVRLSWQSARDFCDWLSKQSGAKVMLPTEAQWEYACRAGTNTPFWFGGYDTDFSKFANLADATLRELASDPYTPATPIKDPPTFDDYAPKDARFNDGALVSCEVGKYQANPWGLFDMHGNVAQWTRSAYRAYPYVDDDRNAPAGDDERVVRGGSWRDRPHRATASFRLPYPPHQRVFNVGFRVVVEE